MKLTTPQFGTLAFTEEQMVLFASGLLSAPGRGHFVVINDPAHDPFQWLVSVEQPDRAVSVLIPRSCSTTLPRPPMFRRAPRPLWWPRRAAAQWPGGSISDIRFSSTR